MRAVLWDLLLLCLFARARGDCRGDCLHCDRQLYRDGFDVLICVLECEGQAVPRATWELCRSSPRPRRLSARARPDAAAAAPALARAGRLRSGDGDEEQQQPRRDEREDASRRAAAGGAAQGLQKRYGGFIGVRKSARKWNNQKRFSQFLRQYLGTAPRSTFRRRFRHGQS